LGNVIDPIAMVTFLGAVTSRVVLGSIGILKTSPIDNLSEAVDLAAT
jgi:hypothetical protein